MADMQANTTVQQQNVEAVEVKGDEVVRVLPSELTGIMPETIWATLSLDQKKEMLRQHNLFEKYFGIAKEEETAVETVTNPQESVPEIKVEAGEGQMEKFKGAEFEKAVEEVKSIKEEKEGKAQEVISPEEAKRIEEETASKANTQTFKFFGYQPSQSTYSNAKNIADDNPVSDSKTWAATLIAKILQLFQ